MNLPSIFRRNGNEPFRSSFNQLQTDFERFLDDLSGKESRFLSDEFCPSCELTEDKSNYFMKLDIPGVKKEDVKIEVDGNMLSVSAERKSEKTSETKKSRYSEISYGSYQRSFTLPTSVNANSIDAAFEDGVLTLSMPKSEQSSVKQIEIH